MNRTKQIILVLFAVVGTLTSMARPTSTLSSITLGLTHTVNKPTVCEDDTLMFTITLTNIYDVAASEIVITDTLPTSIKLLDAYGTVAGTQLHGRYDYSTRTVHFNIPTLLASTHTVTLTVKTIALHDKKGNYKATATLQAADLTPNVTAAAAFTINSER